CADLCEKADFLHIARNNEPNNHVMFQLYIPMYAELVVLNQQFGNMVEALHHARTGLRWLSVCNDNRIRATMMPHIATPLLDNKEYRLVYPLLKQSFTDAAKLELYDCALLLSTELIVCEDKEYMKRPDEYDWIKAGDMLLTAAKSDDVRNNYIRIRDRVLAEQRIKSRQDTTVATSHDLAAMPYPKPEVPKEVTLGTDTAKADSLIQSQSVTMPSRHDARTNPFSLLWEPWVLILIMSLIAITCACLFLIRRWYKRRKDEDHQKSFIEGQESERSRLAKELHDGVANQLLAVEMKLSTDGLTPQAMELLNESREQVRHVSHELLPPDFTLYSLDEILEQYAAQANGMLKCTVTYTSSPLDANWSCVSPTAAMEVFRITQEAVSNAMKHSSASLISIGLHLDEHQNMMLMVSDNGNKAVLENGDAGGIGLKTMHQRAKSIGGTLEFYHHQYGNVVKLIVRK
ncbi:MAG: hypothetical protein J5965_09195, partial [Aeriscardovia sp.]|nr:hypothetical protein [Aeriscardovia sp.]